MSMLKIIYESRAPKLPNAAAWAQAKDMTWPQGNAKWIYLHRSSFKYFCQALIILFIHDTISLIIIFM